MLRYAVAAIIAVMCSSCVPFVQHGPWVRSGTSGGFAVAGSVFRDSNTNDCHVRCVNVGIDFAARAGFVPADSSVPAVAVGLTMPIWTFLFAGSLDKPTDALQFVSIDGYLTGPHSDHYTSSLGTTFSSHHIMPYVQFGSRHPGPNAWYVTQAVLLMPDDNLYLWLPAITKVSTGRRSSVEHLSFGLGAGKEQGKAVYMLSVGVTTEFFHKNARVR